MMGKTAATFLAFVTVITAPPAFADSYAPFRNFLKADPTGEYYVVFKKNGGPADPGRGTPVTFEIARRKPGTPPVTTVRVSILRRGAAAPDLGVREGDSLLGRGSLDRCPWWIMISSTGLGFAGLDVIGYNYGSLRSGDALVVVSADGKIRHRKDLIDLFDEADVAQFPRTAGGASWCGGGWIDEKRKEVVVVSSRTGQFDQPGPRLFRIVDLETGRVRQASSAVITTALSEGNLGALDQAIELAGELKLASANPDLTKILSDENLSIEHRLRAAVALAENGDRRGGGLMRRAVEGAFGESDGYAIKNLARVLGDDAAPILCDVVRREGAEVALPAWQAMHEISGKGAVPPLLRLLREQDDPACIDFAVECLGIHGREAKEAVPELIRLLETTPRTRRPLWTQRLAATALGRIGPDAKAALPALARLAEKHAPDEWEELRSKPRRPRKNLFGDTEYAEDNFIDATFKIKEN